MESKPTVINLFCGAGGFSQGFKLAGFDILLGIDSDNHAINTFNTNHQGRGRLIKIEDVDRNFILREIEKKEIDVIIGGPPCQAFSAAAVAKWCHLGHKTGLKHPFNRLYKEILRLVKEIQPKFFVIENVERMLVINNGRIKDLTKNGSQVQNFLEKEFL